MFEPDRPDRSDQTVPPIDTLPEAILFDFGDTLMEIDGPYRRRGIEALLSYAVNLEPATREALIDQLSEFGRSLDQRFETLCARHNLEYRQTDFHRLLYGKFGIDFSIDDDELEQRYWDASLTMRPEAGLPELLEDLGRRGVRMAVISNTTYRAQVLQRELERHRLMPHFEFVMASADYGIRKPDPLLYEIALQRMHLPPASAWYAGNMITVDCTGATAAGLRPLWYASPELKAGRYHSELPKLPADSLLIPHWTALQHALPTA
ncbi:MAG: HAD family hydrolase [Spirochaetia bacterium]|nr:HAD family hydrolase [Spirochaetia bacterium]